MHHLKNETKEVEDKREGSYRNGKLVKLDRAKLESFAPPQISGVVTYEQSVQMVK